MMTTGEIILMIVQAIVIPFVAWMATAVIDNAKRTSAIEGRFDLYLELVGNKAVKNLHSPHSPEFDKLLDRWLETTNGIPHAIPMTEDELRRFLHKLELVEAEKGDHFRSTQAATLRAIVLSKYPNLIKK